MYDDDGQRVYSNSSSRRIHSVPQSQQVPSLYCTKDVRQLIIFAEEDTAAANIRWVPWIYGKIHAGIHWTVWQDHLCLYDIDNCCSNNWSLRISLMLNHFFVPFLPSGKQGSANSKIGKMPVSFCREILLVILYSTAELLFLFRLMFLRQVLSEVFPRSVPACWNENDFGEKHLLEGLWITKTVGRTYIP